jgi:hypothetical protein
VKAQGHYHVDVLEGPRRHFFRGPTVQRIVMSDDAVTARYRVLDDMGTFGREDEWLSEALTLDEALRLGLELLYPQVEKPAYPCFNSAPWELLGYHHQGRKYRLFGSIPLFGAWPPCQAIGIDGRPVAAPAR